MKRTFIAIKIPVLKQKMEIIADIQEALRDEKIKWVESWNMHITLFFIGDTLDDMIQPISGKLENHLKAVKCFNLKLKGLGVFKSVRDPKVIWIGINHSSELQMLKNQIDEIITSFGFKADERAFKPHLTLGRVKWVGNKSGLKKLIEENAETDFGEVAIDQVIFYESRLTPQGPVYKSLKQIDLKKN